MSLQGYPTPDLEACLESLVTNAYRRDTFTPEEYKAQEFATLALIDAASRRLIENQVDRDVDNADMSANAGRYDAVFGLGDETIMIITSVGMPEVPATNGLFVYIFTRALNYVPAGQIVGFQTAKSVTEIDAFSVQWLSGYTPEQLRTIVDLIDLAKPITRKEYNRRLGEIFNLDSH